MSAHLDTTAKEPEAPSASPRGTNPVKRTLVAPAIGVVQPVVAFWTGRWWLLALMVPAFIALKVFLIMAGVPWWLVAVIAAALIAVKVLLISWHARRAAPQGDRHAG